MRNNIYESIDIVNESIIAMNYSVQELLPDPVVMAMAAALIAIFHGIEVVARVMKKKLPTIIIAIVMCVSYTVLAAVYYSPIDGAL